MLDSVERTHARRPYLTAVVPGTGGVTRERDRDWWVTDVVDSSAAPPAPPPAREKTPGHLVLTVEKTGRTTDDVVRVIGERLDIARREIGCSGATERHAVAVQRITVPASVPREAALALRIPGVRIVGAELSTCPVRATDVRARRYVIVVRDTSVSPPEAKRRAAVVLETLARPPFAPNWFGDERFGVAFANTERGRALVLGQEPRPRVNGIVQKRHLVNTYQAHLFNAYLSSRIGEGLFARVLRGDWLEGPRGEARQAAGEPDEPAVARGEWAITGPLFGARMRRGAWDAEGPRREWRVLEEDGVRLDDFARVAAIAPGARRPIAVRIGPWDVETTPDGLRINLELPRGCYASAIVREILKDAARAVPGALS